ncbi:MAG: 2-desacetyl-2-hydroxyethyl bacteriochlorophyllide A dehydrogenase [Saprospiraceae bacterium]
MKYIVCNEPGSFSLLEKDKPERKQGEALVKITRVGICGTDLHAYQGNQPFFSYPRILGHELAAEIVEIDSNAKDLKSGDAVIIMPYVTCGSCIACRRGKSNCCTDMNVLGVHSDGGMQEYYSIPIELLIHAGNLSHNEIALVEPLAIGAHCIRRAEIEKNEAVLVIGCGPIGLGIIRQAQLEGGNVIVMDVNEDRLTFVREKLNIEHTINALKNPLEELLSNNNQELPTIVIDATGNKKALETGVQYMAHGGKYILVGLYKGDLSFNHPFIHSHEITLLSSRNATLEDMYRVKEILEKGDFPVEDYITHEVSFTEMISKFDSWINPETGVIKAMVHF